MNTREMMRHIEQWRDEWMPVITEAQTAYFEKNNYYRYAHEEFTHSSEVEVNEPIEPNKSWDLLDVGLFGLMPCRLRIESYTSPISKGWVAVMETVHNNRWYELRYTHGPQRNIDWVITKDSLK
jgi:hypothetical protein